MEYQGVMVAKKVAIDRVRLKCAISSRYMGLGFLQLLKLSSDALIEKYRR